MAPPSVILHSDWLAKGKKMPARRKTKLVKRAKPKLPESEEETNMAREEREAKLGNFLKEFDTEVESRVAEMRFRAKQLCSQIDQAFNMEILRLPPHVREMPYENFLGEKEREKLSNDLTHSVEQLVSQAVSLKAQKNDTDSEKDYTDEEKTQTTQIKKERPRKTATAKKTTTRGRRKVKQDENEAPPTVRRSARASAKKKGTEMVTPANRTRMASSVLDTPFMTPKFDPRLPVTPAMARNAKVGEVLMSSNGSPVVATPMHGNKISNMSLSTTSIISPDSALEHYGSLDDRARQTFIAKLQKTLQNIQLFTSEDK